MVIRIIYSVYVCGRMLRLELPGKRPGGGPGGDAGMDVCEG